MPRDLITAISSAEAATLFADLAAAKALVLAVSGGPDSTALMVLAARWRKAMKRGPALLAVTVDHGLRAGSTSEARAVAKLARTLGITHRTVRWRGDKPTTGLPRAARAARYRLLAQVARQAGAVHILTAHTRDDQAETVVMRMSRGSGLGGLAAMQRIAPVVGAPSLALVRPFLAIAKARLVATLDAAKIGYADDPTNRDHAYTRARLRSLMPVLAAEGLDAARLALLAQRLARADEAIEVLVDAAMDAEVWMLEKTPGRIAFEPGSFSLLPAELVIRAFGRAIAQVGSEGPVELGKLERLIADLKTAKSAAKASYRRTLAGAVITLDQRHNRIIVETAPPRRSGHGKRPRNTLTKAAGRRAKPAKSR